MSTHRLGLFFKPMPSQGMAGPPISQVYVKKPIKAEYRNVELSPDTIFLTRREDSEQSIHYAIDQLIAELQELKKEASRCYKKAKP